MILLFVAGCKKNSPGAMPQVKVNSGLYVGGIEKASNGVTRIRTTKTFLFTKEKGVKI
jgi:hypothetical protein